jgi:hypothetical protein
VNNLLEENLWIKEGLLFNKQNPSEILPQRITTKIHVIHRMSTVAVTIATRPNSYVSS